MTTAFSLTDWMSVHQLRVADALNTRLDLAGEASTLVRAMQYATLDGGKRLRAFLVYGAGDAMLSD